MAISDALFDDYADAYVRAVSQIRYADLADLQPPPFACLSNGGAGISVMLRRYADARDDRGARSRAVTWADASSRDRRRMAFQGRAREIDPSSYFYGRAGAIVARVLATSRVGVRGAATYARLARARIPGSAELVGGGAGLLIGAGMLSRHVESPALRRASAALAAELELRVRKKQRAGWTAADATGFAHGWPGVLYALLIWRELLEEPLAPVITTSLAEHVRLWRPSLVAREMRASWCAGAAGMTFTWSAAFARTGDPIFRTAARRAANAAIRTSNPARRHLCCGAGGVAYALLALHKVDPDRGWRDRAREIGARAIGGLTELPRPNGLLWGHPGLVCLALDLVADEPRGFPALEA